MTGEPRSIAEWVRAERKRRGWTQQMLADKTFKADGDNYTKSYISMIECGKIAKPEPETLDKLAKALGANPTIPRYLCGYLPETEGSTQGEIVFASGSVNNISIMGAGHRLDLPRLAGEMRAMASSMMEAARVLVDVSERLVALGRR